MPHEFEPAPAEHAQPTAPQTSAADQRVTPEELQAALRALEGRPPPPLPAAGIAPDAAHVPDTLSIGEAADALSLSIPPDELWREVQQQRAEKEHAQERAGEEQKQRTYTPPPFQQVAPLHAPPLPSFPSQSRLLKRIALTLTALAVGGWLFVGGHGHHGSPFSALSGLTGPVSMVNEDGQTRTVTAAGGTVIVNGDGDTVTVNGEGKALIINGDRDTVRVRGPVKYIVINGDGSIVTYLSTPAPSVTDNGSANSARAE